MKAQFDGDLKYQSKIYEAFAQRMALIATFGTDKAHEELQLEQGHGDR